MEDCNFCEESKLKLGEKTRYESIVIYKIGNSKDGWFATLSPKTGGNPEKDFSIQLMPCSHLKYFSQINNNPELAKNYGIAFARLNYAIAKIIKEQEIKMDVKKIPIGVYGKCKHEDEHIHFKIFPYRGPIGQPFTTDSSFERKEVHVDGKGEEFVRMIPIKKVRLSEQKFKKLSEDLVNLLK